MELDFLPLLIAATLGALAGGDRTAFGQTLLAHPIVAGSLAGWCAGASGPGVWLALGITCIAAARVPVGEARVRDWTSAAIVGPFVAGEAAWTWGFALLLASVVASAGGRAIEAVRELARRRDLRLEAAVDAGDLRALERTHTGLVVAHFVRGGLVTLAAVLVGRACLAWISPRVDPATGQILAFIWWLTPAMGLPILLRFQLSVGSSTRNLLKWLAGGAVTATLAWQLSERLVAPI